MKYLLAIVWVSVSFFCFAQKPLKQDRATDQRIKIGKVHLEAGNYADALSAFESALDRPFNAKTTVATYLCGLTHFYSRDYESANQYFGELTEKYPLSKYVADARYHQALIILETGEPRFHPRAIDSLYKLVMTASEPGIIKNSRKRIQQFLFFETTADTIAALFGRLEEGFEKALIDAWCFRLVEEGRTKEAEDIYLNYMDAGGATSLFLDRLFESQLVAEIPEKEVVKIAMFLPLYLDNPELGFMNAIPTKSKLALEFYEGFNMAVDEYAERGARKIFLKIFDTQRDTLVTQYQMMALDSLQPDLIIGAVYNQQSRIISDWAEAHQVPQIIPLSPTSSLVDEKDNVFLAHPSVGIHGERMADYAIDSLNLTRVAVWTDQKKNTEIIANAFISRFDTLGGESIKVEVDPEYDEDSQDDIRLKVRELRIQEVDGVYIPIVSNQETAGLILSQMGAMDIKMPVMGSPHWWQRYNNIDRELKETYQLLFTTSYMHDKEDPEYYNFYRKYLKAFHLPPSEYNVQGYDLGMFVLNVLDSYDFHTGSLSEYIRQTPAFTGIHLTFDFNQLQINQFVNVGGYVDGQVRKKNAAQILQLQMIEAVESVNLLMERGEVSDEVDENE